MTSGDFPECTESGSPPTLLQLPKRLLMLGPPMRPPAANHRSGLPKSHAGLQQAMDLHLHSTVTAKTFVLLKEQVGGGLQSNSPKATKFYIKT